MALCHIDIKFINVTLNVLFSTWQKYLVDNNIYKMKRAIKYANYIFIQLQ